MQKIMVTESELQVLQTRLKEHMAALEHAMSTRTALEAELERLKDVLSSRWDGLSDSAQTSTEGELLEQLKDELDSVFLDDVQDPEDLEPLLNFKVS